MTFEWDTLKEQENIAKHGVDFDTACRVFQDPKYLVAADAKHSIDEERLFAIGIVDGEVLTVRYTLREQSIRIIGAGFWRKGRKLYEQEFNI